jgi:hypothetical protein
MSVDLAPLTVYVKPELLYTIRAQAALDGRSLSSFVARHLAEEFADGRFRAAGRKPKRRQKPDIPRPD